MGGLLEGGSRCKRISIHGIATRGRVEISIEGITAFGRDSWGPSRDAPSMADMLSSISTQRPFSPMDLEVEAASVATSSPKGKRRKKDKSVAEDGDIQAILKTLAKVDGPSIEECNRVLEDMISITADGLLYCMALIIFCESAAFREQWLHVSSMSEDIKVNWLKLTAKKLGLL